MNDSSRKHWAIVGGGLSGLAAAEALLTHSRQDSIPIEVDLYEASDRLGGVFGTVDQDGYRLETGADMFITNKPAALELARKLGLEDRLIGTDERYRKSLILRKGRPLPTPAGFDLMAPRDLKAYVKSPILSIRGKLRALQEYFLKPHPQEDESLASFAIRRFGREAFERMIQPMIGGIYTADPDKLSLRATIPRFLEMEERYGSVLHGILQQKKENRARSDNDKEQASGARYGLFLSFDEGMSVFQNALVDAVSNDVTIKMEAVVERVEATVSGGYSIFTKGDEPPRDYDGVILAVPSYVAGQLLAGFDSTLSDQLQSIPYASATIVVTGYRLEQIEHDMHCFGLVVPAIEKRNILAVSCTSRKFPGRAPEGSIQLRTFIGGALQQHLLKKSDDELIAITRRELEEIFGAKGEPETVKVVRWNRAMPQYHVGHLQRAASIQDRFATHPGLELAGNSLYGVGLPDVISTAQRAAAGSWDDVISSSS